MAKTLFLGVEGSGKTTLAMALAKAFARHAGEGWYLRPRDRGAYNFATVAPEDFARDGFPRQTASVREMSWRIEQDGEDRGALEILDYPGEVYRLAFLDADDEPDPVAFRERAQANAAEISRLRGALAEAERVFVLFNLQDALNLRGSDANRGAMWVTNESLKAVEALPSKPALTLVFTQVDRYQTDDDFLHAFSPKDLDLVGHDHPDVDWTMVSVMVPPESEFGVDAFVRRATGLESFGVPTGRPAGAAPRAENPLRRLEAARVPRPAPASQPRVPRPDPAPAGTAAPGGPRPDPAPAGTAVPRGSRPDALWRQPVVWWTVGAAALMLVLAVGETLHVQARRRRLLEERARLQLAVKQAAERAESEAKAKAAAEERARQESEAKARAEAARAKADADARARAAAEEARRLEEAARAKAEAERRRREEAEAERRAAEAAVRREAFAAAGRRFAAAALEARAKSARRTEAKRAQAQARLDEALGQATPQKAYEALCEAAEAGLPEAQERLARVYDFWGWGGWVRTKEETGAKWTDWLRRIDFEDGARAVPVSRPAPEAESFRRLALDWYRLAAEQGVEAAAEALRRHRADVPRTEASVRAEAVRGARELADEAEAGR